MENTKKRMLSGLKPSGELTLGNYIGAIKQFPDYEDKYECFVFIPDLHAITVDQDPTMLRERIKKKLAFYIACGVDKNKNTFFIQSENPYHTALGWILECNTGFGEASRMTQFKDKKSKGEAVSVGLFTYPVLMSSDILLYDTDVVPVGIDQKQHAEMARDLAVRMNSKFGNCFVVPEPILPKVGAKIKDLLDPSVKMGKSNENTAGVIYLLEDPEIARKKIMRAVTDSESVVKFDEQNKAGISNLMQIYSSLKNVSLAEVEKEFIGANYGTFKRAVADTVCEFLKDIQAKYNMLISSPELDEILNKGRDKSIKIAKAKYEQICSKIGLGR